LGYGKLQAFTSTPNYEKAISTPLAHFYSPLCKSRVIKLLKLKQNDLKNHY
jgi:hypothetical protein